MIHETDVTLAVLAGGEGSRMGRPKGLLEVRGRPILEHLLDALQWTGPTVLVTAPGREHPPGWRRFDRELVDRVAGQGPLRGVLTALEGLSTPLLVVATVDMPGIGREQLQWIAQALDGRPDVPGCLLRRREADEIQIEPFPSAFRASAADVIRRRLESNRRSVRLLLEDGGFVALDAPPDWPKQVWLNLNRPEDLRGLTE